MPRQGQSEKEARKEIRQEDHRAVIAEQGHIAKVFENIEEIESLTVKKKEGTDELDYKDLQFNQFTLSKLKTAVELRLKLMNKYLPDLRSTEITGDKDNPIAVTEITRTIIG